MAATSFHHHHHHHHHYLHHRHRPQQQPQPPLKIVSPDNNDLMRFKSHTIVKRKSAVQFLQETKPLYVKSDNVLDRKQELRCGGSDDQDYHRQSPPTPLPLPSSKEHDRVYTFGSNKSSNSASSLPLPAVLLPLPSSSTRQYCDYAYFSRSATTVNGEPATNLPFPLPLPLPKNPRLIPPPPAFRKSTSSLQLQYKLRKLLNADSKENLLEVSNVVTNTSRAVAKGNNSEYNSSIRLECSDYYDDDEFKYSSEKCTTSNCHKSLPDLTNIRDSSPPAPPSSSSSSSSCCVSEKSNEATCSCTPYSNSSSRIYASSVCCKNTRNHMYAASSESNLQNDDEHEHVFSLPGSPVRSCTSFITPPPLYCDSDTTSNVKSRIVVRSKSDVGGGSIGARTSIIFYSGTAADTPPLPPLYDSTNLNMFFDNLGLASEEYSLLTTTRSDSSSPIYFESSSGSSISSTGGEYASGSENTPAATITATVNHPTELPSIVERNARIIKWLCNCRKALEEIPPPPHRLTASQTTST